MELAADEEHAIDRRQSELIAILPALAGDDVLVAADHAHRVVWVSDSIRDVLGWDPDQFQLVCTHLVHPADQAAAYARSALIRDAPGWHPAGDGRHLTKEGTWRWLRVSASNLLPSHGLVLTRFRDIHEERELARRLAHTVSDDLTGLATRTVLRSQLTERLAAGDSTVSVLFCDLDGFKAVNDDLGHPAGDRVLAIVARRLAAAIRAGDVIARWGGDEFVAVVDTLAEDEALATAARLRATAAAPIELDLHEIRLTLSIGIAAGRLGDDPDQVVARADDAMYSAKRDGGGIAVDTA